MTTKLVRNEISTFRSIEVTNRSTVYRLFVAGIWSDLYIMACTNADDFTGEFVRIPAQYNDSIAWSYLVEKMPGLAKHGGDKEGWIMAFREFGIEVFG